MAKKRKKVEQEKIYCFLEKNREIEEKKGDQKNPTRRKSYAICIYGESD